MRFNYLLSLSIVAAIFNSCVRHKTVVVVLEGKTKWIKPRLIDSQMNGIFDSLENQFRDDPLYPHPIYYKAINIRKGFVKLWIHLDSLKTLLISKTDNIPWNVADTISLIDIDAKENFDIPTQIMINPAAAKDGSRGEAYKLKILMGQYRKTLINSLANPKDSSDLKIGLLTPDVFNKPLNEHQTWEQYNFEEQPLASVLVTLKRMQNDIENAQLPVLRELWHSFDMRKSSLE